MQLYHRIKKYLFLLASVFVIAVGAHISIVYLYDGAESIAEHGGNISIGFVSIPPNLNPTQYGIDTTNDFVLRLMYRGLLRYNTTTQALEGDLANCDISKGYGEVKCYFKTGVIWNDGSKITDEDILATYSLLAETKINRRIQASLSKLAITREGNAVVFRSANSSNELAQLLMIPIIKKSVAEKFRAGTVTLEDAIYSGLYQYEKKESDQTRGSDTIILVRSVNSPEKSGYSRIFLKYFATSDDLTAQRDSLNIITPSYGTFEKLSSRFATGSTITPDFIGAFINSEKLPINTRKLLVSAIYAGVTQSGSTINKVGSEEDGYILLRSIKNPLFTNATIIEPLPKNLSDELKKLGYFSKSALAELNSANSTSTGSVTNTGAVLSPNPAVVPVIKPAELPVSETPIAKNRYILTPSSLPKVAILNRAEVVVSGNVPSNVDAVYIGGYRLQTYTKGSGKFTYRARTDIGNLKSGNNTYTLLFERGGKKETQESILVYMTQTEADRVRQEEVWYPKPAVPEPVTQTGTGGAITASSTELSGSGSQSASGTLDQTGTVIVETATEVPVAAPEPEKVNDDGKLYLRDGKPATLSIQVINSTASVAIMAKQVETTLKSFGFDVGVTYIEASPEGISNITQGAAKTYDILLSGVNTGYLGTNIFPYFHSGQVQEGFNFSKIRNPNLDILVEELKNKELTLEIRERAYDKVTDILRKESILVPLGSIPTLYAYDRNIKDFTVSERIPATSYIGDSLELSYLKRVYVVNFEIKSIADFIYWCKKQLSNISP